jgi:hypothetical protein
MKLSLGLIKYHAWRHGGVEVELHHPWPWHHMKVSCQLYVPAALPPGEGASGNHLIGGSVGPKACLDNVEYRKTSFPC